MTMLLRQRLFSVASAGSALLLARLLSFGLFVFSARKMSAQDNAGLIYVFGMSQLIVQLGSLGWLNLIRRIASNIEQLPASLARGFFYRSFQMPAVSILTSALLIYGITSTAQVSASVSSTLRYATLVSMLMLPNAIFREYLAGLSRPTASVFLSETLPLALTLAGIWFWKAYDIERGTACLATAFLVAGAIQAALVVPALRFTLSRSSRATFATAQWTKTAAYTLVGFGGKMLMDRMDIIFLASMAGLTSLAYYNSAVRLTGLVLLAPVILIPVFSPRVSRAFNTGNKAQLRDEVLAQIVFIAMAIVPAALILLFSPNALLGSLFGNDYSSAGDIIWIMLIAQSLFALSLPFSNLLLMTDGEVPYAIASTIALAVTYLAAAILIPPFFIHGAALAMLAGALVLFVGLVISGLQRIYTVRQTDPRPSRAN